MSCTSPYPSQSPSPGMPTQSLSAEINAATRKQHARLNRLIIDRLPLALPPNAFDPRLLGYGLAAIARVFYMFEAAWMEWRESNISGHITEGSDGYRSQLMMLLGRLMECGLERTERLENDIAHISSRTEVKVEAALAKQQQQMLDKMMQSIQAKPHLLIAYAWVLYMAIFSGGRYVRYELAKAGPAFWVGRQSVEHLETKYTSTRDIPGFSFLLFNDDHDGEKSKVRFKTELARSDTALTREERQDVVEAAQGLFDDCIALVGMLDDAVWWETVRGRLRVPFAFACLVVILLACLYGWRSFI